MCLILFAYRVVPGVPLLVAANRDEYYGRPAAPAAFWDDQPTLLAGRDLQAGGTWLGVSTTGRFAAVTNFRGAPGVQPGGPSRGDLVRNFLAGRESARSFTARLVDAGRAYAGFCLLAGDGNQLYFFSNQEHKAVEVEPGVHGLSNHLLDTPWPKVVKGRAGLAALLGRPFHDADYLALMDDTVPAAEQELPQSVEGGAQDIAQEKWERSLSSLRIIAGNYGTRCSTVFRQSDAGMMDFAERSYDATGDIAGEVRYRFSLARPGSAGALYPAAASSRHAESLLRETPRPAR
jgi:uncharacterized protein with NRDE domain